MRGDDKKLIKSYTTTLYEYSSTKRDRLLTHPVVRAVFIWFHDSGIFDTYAKQDETMSKNYRHYVEEFGRLIREMRSDN